MDKNLIWSLKIVKGEFESDKGSFEFAINELNNRIKELTPLFNECLLKNIDIRKLDEYISDEWNLIHYVLRLSELLLNAIDSFNKASYNYNNYESLFNNGLVLITSDLVKKYRNELKEIKLPLATNN